MATATDSKKTQNQVPNTLLYENNKIRGKNSPVKGKDQRDRDPPDCVTRMRKRRKGARTTFSFTRKILVSLGERKLHTEDSRGIRPTLSAFIVVGLFL